MQEFPPLRVSESELVEVKSSDSSVMTPVGLLRFHLIRQLISMLADLKFIHTSHIHTNPENKGRPGSDFISHSLSEMNH